jgi:hypothetical protein
MRSSRWKRIVGAGCLSLVVACAYTVAASVPGGARGLSGNCSTREAPLVRGRRVLTLGGYELNVAFSSGGRLVSVDISAS